MVIEAKGPACDTSHMPRLWSAGYILSSWGQLLDWLDQKDHHHCPAALPQLLKHSSQRWSAQGLLWQQCLCPAGWREIDINPKTSSILLQCPTSGPSSPWVWSKKGGFVPWRKGAAATVTITLSLWGCYIQFAICVGYPLNSPWTSIFLPLPHNFLPHVNFTVLLLIIAHQ